MSLRIKQTFGLIGLSAFLMIGSLSIPESTQARQIPARVRSEPSPTPPTEDPNPLPPAFEAAPAPAPQLDPAPVDPEASAAAFVVRARREAEVEVKRLTAEAEQLRARLNKVESGLKRWRGVLDALPGDDVPAKSDAPPVSNLANPKTRVSPTSND